MRIADALLSWYKINARVLPWRSDPQPYKVWISEIMLQQTQVDTVIPYYERWMVRFPDVWALCAASEQDVLAAWEGLGYYSRARNLHKAAQIICTQWGGELPADLSALLHLPGIGRYTAGAIASIAFGLDAPALDGNIRRVYARLFNIKLPLGAKETEQALWSIAETELPKGQAGDYNQALMDFGSEVCTVKQPACQRCPLAEFCLANHLGLQSQLPVRNAKPKVPHHLVTAAIIKQDERVLICKRPSGSLLGGLWEFPGGKMQESDADLADCLRREIMEELRVSITVGDPFGIYKHAYTHFKITLHAFYCSLDDHNQPTALQHSQILWVTPPQLADFPMGKVDRQIASRLMEMDNERRNTSN